MPPIKDKLSQADLRRKVSDYGIRFEGPVPPTQWPDEHKYNFRVIRTLQFLQYEDYKQDDQISSHRRREYQKRVRNIRIKVEHLLDDLNPNEDSWRALEGPIFEKFDRPVICDICNKELSRLDYEANCYSRESQIKLDAKRKKRRMCADKHRQSHEQAKDNDEEHGSIFCFVKGEPITHAPGDNLDNSRIPMKPDGVIGLRSRAPPYLSRDEVHFPARGRVGLLLPFLVLEAKKEKDAPGFRAIQYQTAFAMRRFLKAQAEIDSRDSSCEPCLVWFFAYQGEQWRLHAGTFDHDGVKIYDLWQGTIQSQDGALQLLLIVDYIWSWARDVYRPAIRQLISSSTTSFRNISLISTDRVRDSVSICPTTSSAPASQDSDMLEIDKDIADFGESQQYPGEEAVIFPDASSHTFLQWATGHAQSPLWTRIGSIRHSNIVQFEFQCFVKFGNARLADENITVDGSSLYKTLHAHAVTISARQLDDIASSWTTKFLPISGLRSAGTVRVTLFFQTYCDESSWQIKRVLNCIIWGEEELPVLDRCETEDITKVMLQVRAIHERDSVSLALQATGLVLQQEREDGGLCWKSFAQIPLLVDAFNTLRHLEVGVYHRDIILSRVGFSSRLLWIDTDPDSQHHYTPAAWEQDARRGDSMLAIRSSSWPDISSKFCLFVLSRTGHESPSDLRRLLEEAVSMKNFYGDSDYRWNREDREALFRWHQALVSGTTIVD